MVHDSIVCCVPELNWKMSVITRDTIHAYLSIMKPVFCVCAWIMRYPVKNIYIAKTEIQRYRECEIQVTRYNTLILPYHTMDHT